MFETMEGRLASLLETFATNYEFPHNVYNDRRARLGIPDSGRIIQTEYFFSPSEDSYEFGAVLAKVVGYPQQVAYEVMTSPATIGLTERIINDKLVVVGGRVGLSDLTDLAIQRGFMDDVARVASAHRQVLQALSV